MDACYAPYTSFICGKEHGSQAGRGKYLCLLNNYVSFRVIFGRLWSYLRRPADIECMSEICVFPPSWKRKRWKRLKNGKARSHMGGTIKRGFGSRHRSSRKGNIEFIPVFHKYHFFKTARGVDSSDWNPSNPLLWHQLVYVVQTTEWG